MRRKENTVSYLFTFNSFFANLFQVGAQTGYNLEKNNVSDTKKIQSQTYNPLVDFL